MLVEHGGHGGDVAAPLAMEIIDNYFETVAPADREAPRVGLLRRRAPRPPETRRRRGRRPPGRGPGRGPAAPAEPQRRRRPLPAPEATP